MTAREQAVQTAIGFRGKRNELVDIYNAGPKPLPRRYKVKYEDMLCATGISAVFLSLGWQDIVPPECGAHQLYQGMDALGRGVQDPKRVPEPGDLIFFGHSRYVTGIDHVGIVTRVANGKQIYYFDVQSTMGQHQCPVGYSWIWGYAIPDYESKDGVQPAPGPEPEPDTGHVFKAGDLVTVNPGAKWYRGSSIKLSVFSDQWYILQVKGDRVVLGMNKAETRNIQSPINVKDITLVSKVDPAPEPEPEPGGDSVILPTTLVELPVLRKGAHGRVVETLQLLLNRWHFKVEVDGVFGDATETALIEFQLEWGIEGTHAQVDRLTWLNLIG